MSLNRWSEGFQFVLINRIVFSVGGAGGFLPNALPGLAISSSTGKRVGRLRHPPPGRQHAFGAAFPEEGGKQCYPVIGICGGCGNRTSQERWWRMRMARAELVQLKQRVNLLDLIGGELHKVANSHGGEYAGPCPFCGGEDRLHVQPLLKPGGVGSAGSVLVSRRSTDGAMALISSCSEIS